MINFLFLSLSLIYLLGLGILCNTHVLPTRFWWIANFIQIAPLWILYFSAGIGLIYGIFSKRKNVLLLNVFSILVILFGIMGWNLPLGKLFLAKSEKSIKIVTINAGEGAKLNYFKEYLDQVQPDVIFLQEAGYSIENFLKGSLSGKWDYSFQSGFGLVSRYKVINSSIQTREIFDGSGGIVAEYLLEGPQGPLHLFNVHLETPRKGVEPILYDRFAGIDEMKKVTQMQERESYIASKWVSKQENVIIAGDFNMLTINPIFKEYWSKYQDAFSFAGMGFGYTKYTRWHGVRIDHVLADMNWQMMDAQVGPDLGGDHRPVFAQLSFIGEAQQFPKQIQPERLIKQINESNDVYFFENFEAKVLGAIPIKGAVAKLEYFPNWGQALSLQIETAAIESVLSFSIDNWLIESYPKVGFSYKIPPGVPVIVKALTRFDDFVCLGGSQSAECAYPKSKEYFQLQDDDQWHEIEFNINTSMKSVLSSMKSIKELQVLIPANRHLADQIWIDNFIISR